MRVGVLWRAMGWSQAVMNGGRCGMIKGDGRGTLPNGILVNGKGTTSN